MAGEVGDVGLVLTRRRGERVRIGEPPDEIWVTVVEARDGKVRLGFDAPEDVRVDREEVAAQRDGGVRR